MSSINRPPEGTNTRADTLKKNFAKKKRRLFYFATSEIDYNDSYSVNSAVIILLTYDFLSLIVTKKPLFLVTNNSQYNLSTFESAFKLFLIIFTYYSTSCIPAKKLQLKALQMAFVSLGFFLSTFC